MGSLVATITFDSGLEALAIVCGAWWLLYTTITLLGLRARARLATVSAAGAVLKEQVSHKATRVLAGRELFAVCRVRPGRMILGSLLNLAASVAVVWFAWTSDGLQAVSGPVFGALGAEPSVALVVATALVAVASNLVPVPASTLEDGWRTRLVGALVIVVFLVVAAWLGAPVAVFAVMVVCTALRIATNLALFPLGRTLLTRARHPAAALAAVAGALERVVAGPSPWGSSALRRQAHRLLDDAHACLGPGDAWLEGTIVYWREAIPRPPVPKSA